MCPPEAAGGARETWTLAEAGQKRLVRVRFDDGKRSGRDVVCENGRPKHQVTATLCVFDGDDAGFEQPAAWFAPGPHGVDFEIGACLTENTTRESLMKRPRGFMQHGF